MRTDYLCTMPSVGWCRDKEHVGPAMMELQTARHKQRDTELTRTEGDLHATKEGDTTSTAVLVI